MAVGLRHDWDLSPAEAIALQRELAARVRIEPLAGPIRTVAGVDCAVIGRAGRWRAKADQSSTAGQIIAAAVLLDAETLDVLSVAHCKQRLRFPYVPGLLSFREAPAVIEAVGRLGAPPDLLMCDGQGIAHPRGVGLACHVGLWLDVPTIGVAKSRLCGEHGPVAARRGSRTPLTHDGKVIGAVVRTRDNVKPLFISAGHRVTLAGAVAWTLRCGRGYRLPEPTRQAHLTVTSLKRSISP